MAVKSKIKTFQQLNFTLIASCPIYVIKCNILSSIYDIFMISWAFYGSKVQFTKLQPLLQVSDLIRMRRSSSCICGWSAGVCGSSVRVFGSSARVCGSSERLSGSFASVCRSSSYANNCCISNFRARYCFIIVLCDFYRVKLIKYVSLFSASTDSSYLSEYFWSVRLNKVLEQTKTDTFSVGVLPLSLYAQKWCMINLHVVRRERCAL